MSATYNFRNPRDAASTVKLFLYLLIALSLSKIVFHVMLWRGFSQGITHDDLDFFDLIELVIDTLTLGAKLFTIWCVGKWIVRAHENVWAMGAAGLRITPGWAVGYFFVPVLNLWRPYQAMKALWHASHELAGWRHTSHKMVDRWWCGCYASVILGEIAAIAFDRIRDLEDLKFALFLYITLGVIYILLCLTTTHLVSEITDAQNRAVLARKTQIGWSGAEASAVVFSGQRTVQPG